MFADLKALWQYHELLWMWTQRSVKARYKQTLLGAMWAIAQPLAITVVYAVVFTRFIHVDTGGIPYPVFAYSALLPWTFFAGSLNTAIPSLQHNMYLITKTYFPREVLPFAAVAARGMDFLCAALVFVGLMLFYRVPPSLTMAFLPLLLLIQIILTLGVSLIGAAANVMYRDIGQAVPLAIQLWMYATPIIYPVTLVPERWRGLYMLNPMAGLIDAYRRVILLGQMPQWEYVGMSAVISTLVFVIAYSYFKHAEKEFADVI